LNPSESQIIALVVGTSFAAGLNVYAMLATLGILGRTHAIILPVSLRSVENPWVIAVAIAMFVLHFFADKIPAFDLIWNGLHTFIRIPLAALIAYAATSQFSPEAQVSTTVLAGAIAAVAHTGKFAARAAVTPSPEPFSNMALSAGEDAGAIGITWIAAHHPYIAALIAVALAITAIVLIRLFWRGMRALMRRGRDFRHRKKTMPPQHTLPFPPAA
jgi:hypothetical protein